MSTRWEQNPTRLLGVPLHLHLPSALFKAPHKCIIQFWAVEPLQWDFYYSHIRENTLVKPKQDFMFPQQMPFENTL